MNEKEKMNLFPLHVVIILAFMFLFRLLPAPAPLTQHGMAILGIFIGMIYGWTFTADRGMAWIAFAGLFALGLTDYGTCSAALSAVFASSTAALVLFGMLIMGPIMESDMGSYLVAKLLGSKFCDKKPWNFTLLMIVILPLLQLLLNPWIIILFVLPIFANLFGKVGYKPGDKYPTMFIIGFFIAVELGAALLPWRSWGLFCIGAFSGGTGGYVIDYAPYMIISFVFYFAVTLGYILLMKLMRCNVKPLKDLDVNTLFSNDQKGLTKHQKAVAILVCAMTAGMVFVSFAGGSTGIRAMITKIGVHGVMLFTLACMLCIRVDGKPIGDIKACGRNVPWDMLLVIVSAMVVADALTSQETGVSAWMATVVGPILGGKSEIVFMILLAVITLLLTNVSNNIAVMFVFMAAAGSLYSAGLISNAPATMMIITYASLLGFYTPGSSAYGAAIHGFEYCTSGSAYKYGFIAMVFIVLVIFLTIVPLTYVFF